MLKAAARLWPLALLLVLPVSAQGQIGGDPRFQDPLFRQCIGWLLDGTGGGLIENLCIDNYALPTPSQFMCSRKILTGFSSTLDQEGYALIFEEQARKARAGYVIK